MRSEEAAVAAGRFRIIDSKSHSVPSSAHLEMSVSRLMLAGSTACGEVV